MHLITVHRHRNRNRNVLRQFCPTIKVRKFIWYRSVQILFPSLSFFFCSRFCCILIRSRSFLASCMQEEFVISMPTARLTDSITGPRWTSLGHPAWSNDWWNPVASHYPSCLPSKCSRCRSTSHSTTRCQRFKMGHQRVYLGQLQNGFNSPRIDITRYRGTWHARRVHDIHANCKTDRFK